jgi:hypothetical protein
MGGSAGAWHAVRGAWPAAASLQLRVLSILRDLAVASYTARYDASTAVLVDILRYFWDAATHLFEGLQLYLTL